MTEGAVDGMFDVKWKFPEKENRRASQFIWFSELNGGLITDKKGLSLIKLYPKLNEKNKGIKTGEWAGNGSGIIISRSGHIVTNNHVINDAEEIEVEFTLDNEVKKFNAEIMQVDKVNDLAIIKINDVNFNGVNEPPYNFKTRSSDVGTKVYAFGYPMALSIMGKEIKVTDGIISSKTGFDGDITSYQISAPIQGGNSGGPLFDEKGNLIGINAAKLNVKIADNVGYAIKTSYVLNLIDIMPTSIDLPSNTMLEKLPLTEQIKEISKYVVLIKVK
jgi:S1-C subfamily serine protease